MADIATRMAMVGDRNACVFVGGAAFLDSDGDEVELPVTSACGGTMAGLEVQKSLINKPVKGVLRLIPEFTPGHIQTLIQNRVNCLRFKPGRGFIIAHSLTAAAEGSDYSRVNDLRAVYYGSKAAREAAQPYVGEENDSAGEGLRRLESAMARPLEQMRDGGPDRRLRSECGQQRAGSASGRRLRIPRHPAASGHGDDLHHRVPEIGDKPCRKKVSFKGAHGEEISLLVDGIKIMALQNLSWKASQSKSVIRGAGYRKPHAMGRGPKDYELDFEVKELNKAIIEEAVNSPRSREVQIKKFVVSGQEFTDLLDLRNCTILIVYPPKNNANPHHPILGFRVYRCRRRLFRGRRGGGPQALRPCYGRGRLGLRRKQHVQSATGRNDSDLRQP